MGQGGSGRTGRRAAVLLAVAAVPVLLLVVPEDLGRVRDRLSPAGEVTPVAVLGQDAAPDDGSPRTWSLDVPPGQVLIVDAASVDLVREDEGSRIENANPDRILLVAEGGHPYTVTLRDGRWLLVAEADGRRAFCDRERSRDGDWGVRYLPSSWPGDVC